MNKRAGIYVNNLSDKTAYKSFKPSFLPLSINISDELITSLIEANKQLSLLEGLSKRIPDINLFVSMYVRKEALLSSQIEGTQCTLEDILNPFVEQNTNLDVLDVVNYIKALNYAINRLKDLPLCNRLIKETHAILLENTRGQEKNPGEFRHSQNWIGGKGSSLLNASYIPPNPNDMLEAMSNLETYINDEGMLDPLIKVSLIHYQFETIHPFLDGNGRVGRLLIVLFLMEKGILSNPVLYISYYLKINRIEYYDRMSGVRQTGNYEQWIIFFLKAISETSKDAIRTIDDLINLHDKNTKQFVSYSNRQKNSILKVFNYLESNPIIDIQKTADVLNMSYNTVANVVSILIKHNILKQTSKVGKTKIYSYMEYLDILAKDTEIL